MTPLGKGFVAAGLLALSTTAPMAAERAIIVLDGSGSMWGQIDGRPKLEIARQTLRTVLGTVPADTELGLMAYGHREKGVCTDIELVVPPAAGTAASIADAADRMRFLGKTPLSDAVRQAAESLRYTEEKATVILITDGIETCSADPCALAKELERSGVDFTAHVVGFGLSAEEGRQVACLAENTGGKFIQAKDAGTLADALAQTVIAKPEPEPQPQPQPEPAIRFNFVPTAALAEDTDDLTRGHSWTIFRALPDGSRGERVRTEYNDWKGNLEPGNYVVRAAIGRAGLDQLVTIEDGKLSDPHFVLNAGIVVVRPRASEGAELHKGATIKFDYPGGNTTEYGETRIILPAGEITVNVRIGRGEASETFRLEAGRTVEKDIVVGVGHAVTTASYVPGMAVEAAGLTVHVFKATKSIDGSRVRVQTEYGPKNGFDLPPGDYVAQATLQGATAEAPFTVASGERTEVDVTLNAGVLAIAAPGAKQIVIYRAQKDIQGNRVRVNTEYKAEHQHALTEGEYVVVASYAGDKADAEKAVTVKAGERVEISLP